MLMSVWSGKTIFLFYLILLHLNQFFNQFNPPEQCCEYTLTFLLYWQHSQGLGVIKSIRPVQLTDEVLAQLSVAK